MIFGHFCGFSNFLTPLAAKLGGSSPKFFLIGLSAFHTTNLAWSKYPGAMLRIKLDELKTEFISRFLAVFGDFPVFGPP